MEIIEIFNRIYELPAESARRIANSVDLISVQKGTEIICASEVNRYVYFVRRGIVRAYFNADGREVTFWIGKEGDVALSLNSYVSDRPGYETIAAVEDCELYRIPIQELRNLYEQDICLCNWGRRFAEKEIVRAEKALIPQLFTTGLERYEKLMEENPELLKRVPLEYLSSYLGLTQVSLSRIRGQYRNLLKGNDDDKW